MSSSQQNHPMMTSLNGNIYLVTCPLCREFTGHRWLPCTKASDAVLWCFFDLGLSKRLSKHSWRRWFETQSRSIWRRFSASTLTMGIVSVWFYHKPIGHRGIRYNSYRQVFKPTSALVMNAIAKAGFDYLKDGNQCTYLNLCTLCQTNWYPCI